MAVNNNRHLWPEVKGEFNTGEHGTEQLFSDRIARTTKVVNN
jgi:hypothetical protein